MNPCTPWLAKRETHARRAEYVKEKASETVCRRLPLHNLAHGLGTAEEAGCFGLLDEGVSGRERISRKVQFEGPHLRVSNNKNTTEIGPSYVILCDAPLIGTKPFRLKFSGSCL